ncbi:MAG: translocation/assembly module TamB domain-containing protein [Balneolaceae bacterium]
METDQKQHTTSSSGRLLRWLLLPLILLLLLVALRFSLRSEPVLEWIKSSAVSMANEELRGSLSLDRLEGDMLFGFTLHGVELHSTTGELLMAADSVRTDYSIFQLVSSPYTLDQLEIYGLALNAEEREGTWNLMEVLPEPDVPEAEPAELPPFLIRNLQLESGRVTVNSPGVPDSTLSLREIHLSGGLGFGEGGWSAHLGQLQFLIDMERLEQPVSLEARASAEGKRFTLEHLVLNSGRSLFEANGELEPDQTVHGELELRPLSWLDLATWSDLPLQQDLQAELYLEGRLPELNAELRGRARGLEEFRIDASLRLDQEPALTGITLSLNGLDAPLLTGAEEAPGIGSLELSGEGDLYFYSHAESRFDATVTVSGLAAGGRTLDRLNAIISLEEGRADLTTDLMASGQSATLEGAVEDLFGPAPTWALHLESRGLNLHPLFNEPNLESRLNLTASATGTGFEPGSEPITLDAQILESQWGAQPFTSLTFNSFITERKMNGEFEFLLQEGGLSGNFSLQDWEENPEWSYSLSLNRFDLSELSGLEAFPTELTGHFEGDGSGLDLESLELNSTVYFEPGWVNLEPVDVVEADIELRNEIVYISNGKLESRIADATISLRHHIRDLRDPENRLDLQTEIKDISSLAPLFDVSELNATGSVSGRLTRQDDLVRFDGEADLQEIAWDSVASADRFSGVVEALLTDEPEIRFALDLHEPSFQNQTLQQVHLESDLTLRESETDGSIGVRITGDSDHLLTLSGHFRAGVQELSLQSQSLLFRTPERDLTLRDPFGLTLNDGVLAMETMRLESEDGSAWIQLAIPSADELHQQVELDLRLLDLGTIQRTLFNDSWFEGLLSGSLSLNRQSDRLELNTNLSLTDIEFRNGELDSLSAEVRIDEGRLQMNTTLWQTGEELFWISGSVPFREGDPLTFDDSFFDEPVSGEIRLNPYSITDIEAFLEPEQRSGSEGLIRFSGDVTGSAGNPGFSGGFTVTGARFSNIPVDRVQLDLDYSHEEEELNIGGYVRSLETEVARVSGRIPLYLDMRALRVELPDETDELLVRLNTDEFDLALLENFLDRDLVRDLRGNISGDIELRGGTGTLEPIGEMRLTGGQIRVVPAGVNWTNIGSVLQFQPNLITLNSFSVQSGPGRMTANGSIAIDGLQPGDVTLEVQANQFRAANTVDMNAIIDLNSQFSGTLTSPELSGQIQFRSGFLNLPEFGDSSIETVHLEEDEPEPNFAIYDSLAIDMDVEFDRQFFIRNRQYLDMEVELAGVLDLVKQPDSDLQMFGTIEGVQGYARPLGRNFQVDEAAVTFIGPIDNPEFNIRTLYEPPQTSADIRIWYIIEGTLEDPEFRFDSEPFLELQDIISYTLFGRPFYALESWQQVVSSGSGSGGGATDIAIDLLLDRVELLATRQLGIDVVKIETNRTGSSSTTSIKTGWYLTDRTFFAILNEIGGTSPKTLFMVEYMLRENLELIVTQGDDIREGIDLRWHYDY